MTIATRRGMNKRQRKKRAKQLGLNFGENRHARRRRATLEAHKRPSGESPVRPAHKHPTAAKAPRRAPQARRPVAAETRNEARAATEPTKDLKDASVELAKAAGGLAAEVVKDGVELGVEVVKDAAKKGVAAAAHVGADLVEKVPLVGPAAARKLHDVDEEAHGGDERKE